MASSSKDSGGSKYKAAYRIMEKVVASPAAQVDFTDVQGKVKEGLCEQSSSSLWIALRAIELMSQVPSSIDEADW